ncbi:hypothetical protein CYK25_006875 [Varibaculum cambriense]|nr:hypothetical protein CYK25_006875 [Varibaculum cambriense]
MGTIIFITILVLLAYLWMKFKQFAWRGINRKVLQGAEYGLQNDLVGKTFHYPCTARPEIIRELSQNLPEPHLMIIDEDEAGFTIGYKPGHYGSILGGMSSIANDWAAGTYNFTARLDYPGSIADPGAVIFKFDTWKESDGVCQEVFTMKKLKEWVEDMVDKANLRNNQESAN